MKPEKICVLGGGSWGATLAAHLSKKGHDVIIWEFLPAVAEQLKKERTLSTLPQLRLPDNIEITTDIKKALEGRDIIFSVTPSHTVRSTFTACKHKGALRRGALVVTATKGIENSTHATMSQIIHEIFPEAGDIVILSGPSHAEEVAAGQPVVLVAASTSETASRRVRDLAGSDLVRVYTSHDPVGVELGGSLKNIYAVACGIVDGLQLGDNAKAALMTRGLVEITRLGKALGAEPLTFFGLSGLGDLIVTCNSRHSRNRLVGEKIGQGKTLTQALAEMTMVAEGVNTTKAAYDLAKMKNASVPIINEMYKILFEEKSPKQSIKDLMSRPMGAEMEGIVL